MPRPIRLKKYIISRLTDQMLQIENFLLNIEGMKFFHQESVFFEDERVRSSNNISSFSAFGLSSNRRLARRSPSAPSYESITFDIILIYHEIIIIISSSRNIQHDNRSKYLDDSIFAPILALDNRDKDLDSGNHHRADKISDSRSRIL